MKRLENGAIWRGVAIAPRGGNGEPEDRDLHPLLQQQITLISHREDSGPGSDRVARAELLDRKMHSGGEPLAAPEFSVMVKTCQDQLSRLADNVILVFRTREIGHPAFASVVALSKAALLPPGMRAFTSR